MYLDYIFFIVFLTTFVASIKILFESNIDQIMKKGRIILIRVLYVFLAIAIAYLVSSGISSFIESIINIIQK